MNRTERLAAILIRLQARSLVRARELAEEFEVGIRTIYRDMEALAESGVPLRAEAGVGYALERGWKLPPLSLGADEASALLLACRLAEGSEDEATAQAMRSALAKVRAVLAASERDYVERLDEGVEAFAFLGPREPGRGEPVRAMREALARGRLLRLSYRSASGQESERVVEPLGLFREPRGWRLLAFCRERHGYRQFLAARTASASLLGETFDRSSHPSLEELLRRMGASVPTFEARIRCRASAARAFAEQAYALLEERLAGDRAELRLVVGDPAWFARATLGAAAELESVEPAALAEAYREQAAAVLAAFGRMEPVGPCLEGC
ncbi:MAG TPA: YafY family protein [Spirochaetia bacterium]|nr:YafY family protein [Spirochaetia bacterium]HRZ65731.1 YafY family protein [Spirochaetia bacterium]